MSIKHRLKRLERKAGLNQPIRHAPPLFNPSTEEIEEVRRKYPDSVLFVLNLGGPEESYGVPPGKACR